MSASVPLAELGEWLAAETGPAASDVAVLAGHFAIYSAGGMATELLDSDSAPPGIAEMLDFTRLTWRAACVAASHAPGSFRFVVLVDDIQFVRPVLADRPLAERLAAELAAGYLDRIRDLPAHHAAELARSGLGADRVLRHSAARALFSERELRMAAVRHLRRQLGALDGTARGLVTSDDGSTVTVTVPDHGEYCLVHSGHTTCAGGYVELLSQLHERGIRKLVALVPMRCLGQVALGTALARHLFAMHQLQVVNVGVPDPALAGAATVVD